LELSSTALNPQMLRTRALPEKAFGSIPSGVYRPQIERTTSRHVS
jgi:hypothetical protein